MYTEEQLNKLIADVTTEFTTHLAKAEDESKKPGEEHEKVEHEKEEDKGPKDQDQEDKSKPEEKGDKMESKEERQEEDKKENEKPSEDPHGEAEDHGYDDEDMAHMHSMYGSMSKGELKAHHDCIRKCMDGMGKAEQPEMAKSEKDAVIEVENQEVALLKSELATVKAANEDSKKQLEAVTAFLTKFVEKTAPAGKAITSLDIIAKGETQEKPLNKSEIDSKLMAKARDLSLSKSDRDAINSYYCGSKNIEIVRHLLK